MSDLMKVTELFQIEGEALSCDKYGNGHINDTYLVVTFEKKYIFQRINHLIFKNVEMLMRNQELVTYYIAERLAEKGDFDKRLLLKLIFTKENKSFLRYEDNYYRCYEFIEGGECLEKINYPFEFEISGVAFGRFQKLLNGFEANKLYEVIPDFHNTCSRFKQLQEAIKNDIAGKAESCKTVIEEFLNRERYCDEIIKGIKNGEIPIRVTHNDTKLNNVLIDTRSHQPLAVLDLDTVMPGSIIYDFGDSIRYGANTAAEDERNLNKVKFSMDLFKAFTRGFMSEVKDILTKEEVEKLAFGAILITYECGMRFLADHLNGDVYFKTHRENHNLDRAKTQLKMVCDMERQFKEMNAYVRSFYE